MHTLPNTENQHLRRPITDRNPYIREFTINKHANGDYIFSYKIQVPYAEQAIKSLQIPLQLNLPREFSVVDVAESENHAVSSQYINQFQILQDIINHLKNPGTRLRSLKPS